MTPAVFFASFASALLISSVSVRSSDVFLNSKQTAAHLQLFFHQINVSDLLFVCEEGHSSYKNGKCLVRLSVCPVPPETAIFSDNSLRHCLRGAGTGHKADKNNSMLLKVSLGKGLTFSKFGGKGLSVNLGLRFTNYVKWQLMRMALLFQGIVDIHNPTQDIPIAEFVLPLFKGNDEVRDHLMLEPKLEEAKNLLKNISNKPNFQLASISFRSETHCSHGFFPKGECTFYTGCQASFCQQCDQSTGASLCSPQECYTYPKECQPSNGKWSDWSKWSECPAVCGWSLATQHRDCNNPPPSGNGTACVGDAVQVKMCRQICNDDQLHQDLQQNGVTEKHPFNQKRPHQQAETKRKETDRVKTHGHRQQGYLSSCQHWLNVEARLSTLQHKLEHQWKHLHHERFWVRTALGLALCSLILSLAWISVGVCQQKANRRQPCSNSHSNKTNKTKSRTNDQKKLLKDDDMWSAEVDVDF